eukprot:COSAG06_NODE_1331_length_9844_cov_4.189636_9_plen_352_part_00
MVITSTSNPLVRRLIRLRTSAKQRRLEGRVLVVGARALSETLRAPRDNAPFVEALLLPASASQLRGAAAADSRGSEHPALLRALADAGLSHGDDARMAQTAAVSRFADARVLRRIAGLSSFDGPVGCVALPPTRCVEDPTPLQRLLVLSGVTDPGNVGTLLRTALGLGWDAAFLIQPDAAPAQSQQQPPWPHCADPFGDKALRAAAGAAFSLPLIRGSPHDLIGLLQRQSMSLLVADLLPPEAAAVGSGGGSSSGGSSRIALCLSNEAHGAARLPELLGLPSHSNGERNERQGSGGGVVRAQQLDVRRVCIPMSGGVDSLNVATAGGILMYQLAAAAAAHDGAGPPQLRVE